MAADETAGAGDEDFRGHGTQILWCRGKDLWDTDLQDGHRFFLGFWDTDFQDAHRFFFLFLICVICEICVRFFNPIQVAFAFVIICLSLYLWFGAEIQEKADFVGGGFQVIQ